MVLEFTSNNFVNARDYSELREGSGELVSIENHFGVLRISSGDIRWRRIAGGMSFGSFGSTKSTHWIPKLMLVGLKTLRVASDIFGLLRMTSDSLKFCFSKF